MSELRGLGAVHETLRARGGGVVAIAAETVAHARQIAVDQRLPFPVLADTDSAVIAAYGLLDRDGTLAPGGVAIPAQILIDRDGRVVWRHVSRAIPDRLAPHDTLAAIARVLGA